MSQGDNFSRCGKWSRFQRAKAASRVSANRNGSVGDSTWPSQKTTLALPLKLTTGGRRCFRFSRSANLDVIYSFRQVAPRFVQGSFAVLHLRKKPIQDI